MIETICGVMIPFLGTALGAALVFPMRREIHPLVRRALTGFAAGVMMAASVWSLLIPSIGQSAGLGRWAFVPAAGGFWAGLLFLRWLDGAASRLSARSGSDESDGSAMLLAVTLHNVPEGMAVGVAYAGMLAERPGVTSLSALSLAMGIAIQNLPEGAIISLPLRARGLSRRRAFAAGALSGAVEPLGAALMVVTASRLLPAMPWLLGFAAGAMICVAVEELIPEMARGPHAAAGTALFAAGFTLMMALDVALSQRVS